MTVARSLAQVAVTSVQLLARQNQEDQFTRHQSLVQRILAVLSSCTSIVFCFLAIYGLLAIDPKRFVFRHQLIFFLIFFDLLKACILLLYPSRVLTHYTAYYNDRFCQVVGFFTATAIEGADIAILSFAIHTFLLIFKPQLTVRVKNSERTEGGLYRYRYFVYALSFVIPIVLASLAFIKSNGYDPFVCWCYLPQRPIWYRLVLSWVPRYIIVIIIFLVYGLIYFHVIQEFKTLGGVFKHMHKPAPNLEDKPSFFSAVRYFFTVIKGQALQKLTIPDDQHLTATATRRSNVDPKEGLFRDRIDTKNILGDPEIQLANLENFRKRQKSIEKQMKSIFIYPFAYCFVWLFPFILQCTQFNHEEREGPVYWLNCMGAFMQPLNGFVDALVFFYRERPWEQTVMYNYEKDHEAKMDSLVMNDNESLATSTRFTKPSLSASMGVDLTTYSWWRRVASHLRLPLLRLPTDDNITRFQVKYLNNKLQVIRGTQNELNDNGKETRGTKHDYSNILSGELTEKDFRLTLEKFTFNFGRRSSMSSLTQTSATPHHPGGASTSGSGTVNASDSSSSYGPSESMRRGSALSTSNTAFHPQALSSLTSASFSKPSKSRHMSIVENTDPILEGRRYKSSLNSSPQSNMDVSQKPHQLFSNTAASKTLSLLNSIQQQRKNTSAGLALDPTSPLASNFNARKQKPEEDDDTEMDFLEFLKKGP